MQPLPSKPRRPIVHSNKNATPSRWCGRSLLASWGMTSILCGGFSSSSPATWLSSPADDEGRAAVSLFSRQRTKGSNGGRLPVGISSAPSSSSSAAGPMGCMGIKLFMPPGLRIGNLLFPPRVLILRRRMLSAVITHPFGIVNCFLRLSGMDKNPNRGIRSITSPLLLSPPRVLTPSFLSVSAVLDEDEDEADPQPPFEFSNARCFSTLGASERRMGSAELLG